MIRVRNAFIGLRCVKLVRLGTVVYWLTPVWPAGLRPAEEGGGRGTQRERVGFLLSGSSFTLVSCLVC